MRRALLFTSLIPFLAYTDSGEVAASEDWAISDFFTESPKPEVKIVIAEEQKAPAALVEEPSIVAVEGQRTAVTVKKKNPKTVQAPAPEVVEQKQPAVEASKAQNAEQIKKMVGLQQYCSECARHAALAGLPAEEKLQAKLGEVVIRDEEHAMTQPEQGPMDKSPAPDASKEKCVRAKMFAEFLWWTRSGGIEFVSDGVGRQIAPAGNTDIEVTGKGKSYAPNFKFKPGVRAGIGLNFGGDGWDTELSLAWVRHESSRHFEPESGRGLAVPENFFMEAQGFQSVQSAQEEARQNLYFSEWALGRKVYVSKWLTLRPLMNVAGAYLPTQIRTSYHYTTDTTPGAAKSLVHRTRSYGLGFGGGVGLDTEWHLTPHFSFLGNFHLSALWTNYSAHGTEHMTTDASGVTIRNMNGHYSINQMQYIRNIFLGANWHTNFSRPNYFFSVYAGWTFLTGFNNFFVASDVARLREESNFQGLNAGIKFNF